MTPTARTLAYCRERGWPCGSATGRRGRFMQDLFGFVDLVVLEECQAMLPIGFTDIEQARGNYWRMVLVQVTAGSAHAARRKKIRDILDADLVLAAALRALEPRVVIEVWSWSKRGPRGKRKVWELKRERV